MTAIGQKRTQDTFKLLLKVPDELSIIDIMCFGPPLKPSSKRWKKDLNEIMNWDTFNPDNLWSDERIEDWCINLRAKVMDKDESYVD